MKTRYVILLCMTIFLVYSCGKDTPVPSGPAPVLPKPDTLSAGWKKITVDSSETLNDIFFFNSNTTGYLAGLKGLYKTTNGGTSWNTILSKTCTNLAVTPDGKVFMVNSSDTIYKSVDGGSSFTTYKITGNPITDIFFTDNNNGYCITHFGLFNTSDGGNNWSKIVTTGINFIPAYASLHFKNNNTGWIVTGGNAYKTNGSAGSWTSVIFSGTGIAAPYYSVFATSGNNVYLSSNTTGVYKSADGINFSLLSALRAEYTRLDIHFVNDDTGFVSGLGRIYKTADGGQTWSVVAALGEAELIELHFTDAAHGWACGSKGTVLLLN